MNENSIANGMISQPEESSARIQSFVPAGDNWFCVKCPEANRWFMERVVGWAIVRQERSVDTVRPILPNGMPANYDCGDHYVVNGEDQSPFGSSWLSVFLSVKPTMMDVREISHLLRDLVTDRDTQRQASS